MTEGANDATPTDPCADEWTIDDEVIQFREWGTQHVHPLPPIDKTWTIGASEACDLQILDRAASVSRIHAELYRERTRWAIRDLDSKNGTRLDGSRRLAFSLVPGAEIGFGRVTLIAESARLAVLRGFLARLLGWGADRLAAIDRALRAVRIAATRRNALLVCGHGDLVPIMQNLHRQTLGAAKPFIVCDPRRGGSPASVRSAESHRDGLEAMQAALGGTMCIWARRMPRDFREVSLALRDPASRVQLVVCASEAAEARAVTGDPVVIPVLGRRGAELARIVEEYGNDAVADLVAEETGFTRADRTWVIEHSASSLPEIEKGARRLTAIRQAGSIARAAARLGMSHVALSQWIGRRRLP